MLVAAISLQMPHQPRTGFLFLGKKVNSFERERTPPPTAPFNVMDGMTEYGAFWNKHHLLLHAFKRGLTKESRNAPKSTANRGGR